MIGFALSLTAVRVGLSPVPPHGAVFVVRIRDGVTQHAVSPTRDNAHAIHRSA